MNEENQNANAGANNESVGAKTEPNTNTGANTEPVTFDDFLKGEGNQAEFDRRVQKAIETARIKWQEKNDEEKTEAEKLARMNETEKLQYELKKQKQLNEETQRKLNARDLKDEALKIATTQDTAFDPEFLNLFDYETMTAEGLQEKTKLIKSIQDRIVEKTINEWSKEKPPYNPQNQDSVTTKEAELRKAMGLN